ncbi:hypothetical protein FPV67DRAFT_1670546 [Lyophyllum atratum]|nr:hypothetical protein FPV67DRAFT_1670546 [Lyophyllum atratum]
MGTDIHSRRRCHEALPHHAYIPPPEAPAPSGVMSEVECTQLLGGTIGRLYRFQDLVYYSPICTRQIPPPQPWDDAVLLMWQNQFYTPDGMRLMKYLRPRPYVSFYPYIPFIAMEADFDCPLFDSLKYVPSPDHMEVTDQGLIQLPNGIIEKWTQVEYFLQYLTDSFAYSGIVKPTRSGDLGYKRGHRTRAIATRQAQASKQWMRMLMAFVTWTFAQLDDIDREMHEHIQARGFDMRTIQSLKTSSIMSPHRSERVGAFVTLEHLTILQCRQILDVMVKWRAPPFYIWGDREESLYRTDPMMRHYAPPQEVLQEEKARQSVPRILRHTLSRRDDTSVFLQQSNIMLPIPRQRSSALSPLHHPLSKECDSTAPNIPTNDVPGLSSPILPTRPPSPESAAVAATHLQCPVPNPIPTWQTFFAKRELRDQQTLRNESPHARQSRVSRMEFARNSFSKRSTYYYWDTISDSPGERQRTKIDKNCVLAMMVDYRYPYRRYDPFRDEWDLCTEFGGDDGEPSRLEEDNVIYDDEDPVNWPGRMPKLLEVAQDHSMDQRESVPTLRPTFTEYSPTIIKVPVVTDVDVLSADSEVVRTLQLMYGFIVPEKPLTMSQRDVPDKLWIEVMRSVGSLTHPRNTPNTLRDSIQDFVTSFKNPPPNNVPNPHSWDILDHTLFQNSKHLTTTGQYHILAFENNTEGSPDLAFDDAYILLVACRIMPFTYENVVGTLVQHCIPFHTVMLYPYNYLHIPREIEDTVPDHYPSDYKFTMYDWREYLDRRRRFITSERGRGAILKGGIVARIAQDVLEYQDRLNLALDGPSVEVLGYRRNCLTVLKSQRRDRYLYDDVLSDDECNLICGVYYLRDGPSGNRTMYSWWPPVRATNSRKSAAYVHFWTEKNERWYTDRLQQINKGQAAPMRYGEWTQKMNGHKYTRAMLELCEERAKLAVGKLTR